MSLLNLGLRSFRQPTDSNHFLLLTTQEYVCPDMPRNNTVLKTETGFRVTIQHKLEFPAASIFFPYNFFSLSSVYTVEQSPAHPQTDG